MKKTMVNLGKMIGTSPQHIVIRSNKAFDKSNLPKEEEIVFDKMKKKIGKIKHVFGPTKTPFFSVKPIGKATLVDYESQIGDSFYTFQRSVTKPQSYSKSRNYRSNNKSQNYRNKSRNYKN